QCIKCASDGGRKRFVAVVDCQNYVKTLERPNSDRTLKRSNFTGMLSVPRRGGAQSICKLTEKHHLISRTAHARETATAAAHLGDCLSQYRGLTHPLGSRDADSALTRFNRVDDARHSLAVRRQCNVRGSELCERNPYQSPVPGPHHRDPPSTSNASASACE